MRLENSTAVAIVKNASTSGLSASASGACIL